MDLANTTSTQCPKCNSTTMKYDLNSQLFKCFNSRCGFIDSLTVISYSDEVLYDRFDKEEATKTSTQITNGRRYVYGAQEDIKFNKLNDYEDPKNPNQKKAFENTKQDSTDVEDRIRYEVNSCKRLIRKWCDFMNDRKIEFEIIEHFLDLVYIDQFCTAPSVKRKAAGSFCFVVMKYIGQEADLEEIAKVTGVPFDEVVREQGKIKNIKFSHKRVDQEIPVQLQISENNQQTNEWEKFYFYFAQKMIFHKFKQNEKIQLMGKKKGGAAKYYQSYKDVKLGDYLKPEEQSIFQLMEQNIKNLNPNKNKYEKNKICASIVFTFCLLTTVEELSISSPLELSVAINLHEKSIIKYYEMYILPFKDQVIPKQDIWKRRKDLNFLVAYQ